MKKKGIKLWIKKNQDILALLLVVIGVGGTAYAAGFTDGSQQATQFYNDTIAELNSRCIMMSPAANASIKTTLTYKHGDEGVYRPEDWQYQKK